MEAMQQTTRYGEELHQLTLLLNSLDLIDPEKNPIPVADATLEILSNLDKTLESTVSAVVSLTLESPLADENHDHDLQKLKAFRCSYLQKRIKLLVGSDIYHHLFRYLLPLFIRWCAIADITVEDDLKEGSDLRERIQATISYCNKTIARTILWCRRSDWTIIHIAWIGASVTVNDVLETLTCRTNCTTQSTPAADPNNNEQTNAKTELIFVAAQSAIPLVKLARILVTKTTEKIWQKRMVLARGTTLELNSETIRQLHETPTAIDSLNHLSNLLMSLDRPAPEISDEDQDSIRYSVQCLPKDMESTLTILDSVLIPLLAEIEDDLPEPHLKPFIPDLKQCWDEASKQLLDVILSFGVEHLATWV
ncbi:hypothetical protein PtA15_8A212 [Puccinia triticina]|uniref:Uncharacterized protein n=1 Tax=Puccinia triticina TaxID=208348 RepID=A0ABY7CPY1_9BASI|nr:uncharacterized protein PtA15_8A212 [Puccinia triticina]WAQ87308.1 hypothetical protein PtA15_8A212 [Puccinia triticina]WAR57162.1 hypothetical protein PtB15_8B209 [Puccinia triticina]